jgi:hypothetical protein
MKRIDRVRQLIGDIHYQSNCPEVTTVGHCSMNCGSISRGSGVCLACLAIELGSLVGDGLAKEYVAATEKHYILQKQIIEKALHK